MQKIAKKNIFNDLKSNFITKSENIYKKQK